MANYLQFGQALAKHLPMSEGCTSTVKLGKKGIEALAKKNPELGKVIAEFTEGVTNPTLEIAQKAQGNYAIAGFKIKNGETILGKGAYSTSTGAKGAVEKMHIETINMVHRICKEGDNISEVATFKPIKFYREKILEMSQKPNCNNYELKQLINEADNTIYSNYKTACDSLDESLIKNYLKELKAEIKYIDENPEYQSLLENIRSCKFNPDGSFNGFEYALDRCYGLEPPKRLSMKDMYEVLRDNYLYDIISYEKFLELRKFLQL